MGLAKERSIFDLTGKVTLITGGNSGIFLPGGVEIQVLDNYDNPTYADGFACSVYGVAPPLANALRPPGRSI
jgi:hypothetical protein